MKVQITFTADVDSVEGDPLPPVKEIEAAVAEAVQNAMQYAQGEGHVHSLRTRISILMDSEVSAHLL